MRINRLIACLFLLFVNFTYSQNTASFDTLLNNLKRYDKQYGQEKVHLHFDKPFYALGDTIWFEGYVADAENNKPIARSRILHVELINAKDSICLQLQLPVSAGFAPGDITLSEKLKAGVYRIRAYTNWMRNFDASWFFNKAINIVDPFSGITGRKKPEAGHVQNAYDIQFFPEGGNLVEGILSTVAFKAISSTGESIEVSGKLVDEQNNNILDFKTIHAGMGSFALTPGKGKIYRAVINLPDSLTKTISLPEVAQSGYVIRADNRNPDSLFVTLLASPDLVNKEEMVLMPLSNGKPLFLLKNKFPDTRVNISIPKGRLPGGIIQLTLFNLKSEPVAERLVFNDYHERMMLNVEDLNGTYKKRDKTELSIQATNVKGQPLLGSFSIAVTNADQIKADDQTETTIISNLLLTSDLKGHVENPNYYFIELSPQKISELDNLMLTQGWRRFVWRDLANGVLPNKDYQPEQTIVVSGTVVNSGRKPVPGAHINLLPMRFNSGTIRDTTTDVNGHFVFNLPIILAGGDFILQTKQKENMVKLELYTPPPIVDYGIAENIFIENKATTTATGFSNIKLLKEVIIRDPTPRNKLRQINSTSVNLNGPGNADQAFTFKEIENWRGLEDLYGKLPGVTLQNGTLKLSTPQGEHAPSVLILVDGQTGYGLNNFPMQDIESIEFMKSVQYIEIYGLRGSGGVLEITTKKGVNRFSDTTLASSVLPLKLPVYMAKEFYSPKYDKSGADSKVTDIRTTIYWKPNIITGNDGKAKVEFYNTDVTGNYKIVIEGISAIGNLCREVFYYKVQ